MAELSKCDAYPLVTSQPHLTVGPGCSLASQETTWGPLSLLCSILTFSLPVLASSTSPNLPDAKCAFVHDLEVTRRQTGLSSFKELAPRCIILQSDFMTLSVLPRFTQLLLLETPHLLCSSQLLCGMQPQGKVTGTGTGVIHMVLQASLCTTLPGLMGAGPVKDHTLPFLLHHHDNPDTVIRIWDAVKRDQRV